MLPSSVPPVKRLGGTPLWQLLPGGWESTPMCCVRSLPGVRCPLLQTLAKMALPLLLPLLAVASTPLIPTPTVKSEMQ